MLHGRRLALAMLCVVGGLLMAVSPAMAAEATVKRHGDKSKMIVALTFDDGYNARRAKKIADILDQYGVTGTFMPYANAVNDSPAAWKSIARRFPIANHTVSHGNLTRRTASQVYAEIDGARRMIEKITGKPMLRIFRPPYMAYNRTVLEQAHKAGFKTVALWNVDGGDSIGKPTDEQVYRAAIGGGKGAIVLLHAGPAVTPRVLGRIIENYQKRGFRFVTLGEMLGVPWNETAKIAPRPTSSGRHCPVYLRACPA